MNFSHFWDGAAAVGLPNANRTYRLDLSRVRALLAKRDEDISLDETACLVRELDQQKRNHLYWCAGNLTMHVGLCLGFVSTVYFGIKAGTPLFVAIAPLAGALALRLMAEVRYRRHKPQA